MKIHITQNAHTIKRLVGYMISVRKQKLYSQEDIAKRCKVSKGRILRLESSVNESADVSKIDLNLIVKYLNACGEQVFISWYNPNEFIDMLNHQASLAASTSNHS